jgi:hypothetical protein
MRPGAHPYETSKPYNPLCVTAQINYGAIIPLGSIKFLFIHKLDYFELSQYYYASLQRTLT